MKDKFYSMPHYLYILTNPDWKGKCKFGYTKNYQKRLLDSSEQHSALSNYRYLYQVKANANYKLHTEYDLLFSKCIRREDYITELNQLYQFQPAEQFSMLEKIRPSLINEGGGTEFIKEKGIVALTRFIESREGYQKLGLEVVKQFTSDEIAEINLKRVREFNERQALEDTKYESIFANIPQPIPLPQPIQHYVWNPRQYQIEIIAHSIQELRDKHKIYIELATGGGKSYIVFNILNEFRPDVIVIFSPRKKINEQNLDKRYLSLLEDKYETFNMSSEISPTPFLKKTGKKIIICCSQSAKRLHYHLTKSQYNFKDVMVWYDEAHWGFGEWLNEENEKYYTQDKDGTSVSFKKFWLEDNNMITNRVFVSASPNHKLAEKKENVYGRLLNHITVSELIKEKWLCPIIPHSFELDKNSEEIQILKYIFQDFKKENRKWGFSFHSKQTHAFSLFYYHFQEYIQGKTDIKPYILIGDDFYDIFKKTDEELKEIQINENKDGKEIIRHYTKEEINDIKKVRDYYNTVERQIQENRELTYLYQDIKSFEKKSNSMGYVVQKFSMGYDFSGIDYIIFSDRKSAPKDIIQCIGRGTRSDKLENGRNKEKTLKFYIPVYYDDNKDISKKYDFKNVIEVLRYLILNLKLDIQDMITSFTDKKGVKKMNVFTDGNDKMSSQLIDLLYNSKILRPMDLKRLYKFCIENKIKSEKDYNQFKLNINIRLKDNIYEYTGFYWQNVLDTEKTVYYSSLRQCEEAKQDIRKKIEIDFSNNKAELKLRLRKIINNVWLELKNYDSKIPPFRDLERFYPK
jgi:superfamily II DNA or RNA helicase